MSALETLAICGLYKDENLSKVSTLPMSNNFGWYGWPGYLGCPYAPDQLWVFAEGLIKLTEGFGLCHAGDACFRDGSDPTGLSTTGDAGSGCYGEVSSTTIIG
jgi:hypothetical protein